MESPQLPGMATQHVLLKLEFICLVDIGGYITLDIIIIYDFQLFIVNRRNHIRLTSESEGLHEHNIL